MGSITGWITGLKGRDERAAERLWNRYFSRLVRLARRKLGPRPRGVADEEDVALAAFASLCKGAARGRFPLLRDRDSLWPLLVVITARKAVDQIRYERAGRRGGDSKGGLREITREELENTISREPSPLFLAQIAEEYDNLLGRLGEGSLREIAVWRMEGYTNDEIAERLGCSRRSVARKLVLIRKRLTGGGPT